MKYIITSLIIALSVFAINVFTNCNSVESEPEKVSILSFSEFSDDEVVTSKIMYDVPIENPLFTDRTKNNPDWFWENLPEPAGSKFITQLIDDVKKGKRQAYYYDPVSDYDEFIEIPIDEQQKYLKEFMTISIDYIKEEKKVTQKVEMDHTHVNKLRFLEEWYLAGDVFYKRVIAVAPFFTIDYPGIDEQFSTVFFWILIDDETTNIITETSL